MTTIEIINESTVCTDEQIQPIVAALQRQVSGDYAPLWGMDASLVFVGKGKTSTSSMINWQLIVLDDSDQAGALGYHDVTDDGLPMGKVFAKTDQQYGDQVSVTMSHELLEMLGDPSINKTATMNDGRIYAVENCDAVEDDSLGYVIDGILVSDFVTPDYFSTNPSNRYDFLKRLSGPCPALTQGGYISVLDPATGSWSQILGSRTRATIQRANPPLGSRRWRRQVPPSLRLRSLR